MGAVLSHPLDVSNEALTALWVTTQQWVIMLPPHKHDIGIPSLRLSWTVIRDFSCKVSDSFFDCQQCFSGIMSMSMASAVGMANILEVLHHPLRVSIRLHQLRVITY